MFVKMKRKPLKNNGEPCWIRTSDLLIKSPSEILCFQWPLLFVWLSFANGKLPFLVNCRNGIDGLRRLILGRRA